MESPVQLACGHCDAINRVPAAHLTEAPMCGRCSEPLLGGKPLVLDAEKFERHAKYDDVPLLVDFWATSCPPCGAMAPEFEQAVGLLEPSMRLAKLDTETAPSIAARYFIRSVPTLVLFRDGREIARQAGVTNAESIAQWARAQLH